MPQIVRSPEFSPAVLPSGAKETQLIGSQEYLSARFVELLAGTEYPISTEPNSDQYLYVVSGAVTIKGANEAKHLAADSFATFHEGDRIAVTGQADESKLYLVTAKNADLPGTPEGIQALKVEDLPVVEVPEQLKQRIYLIDKSAIPSERSHAMIVNYTGDTLTKSHHHPNAESVFFFLRGNAMVLSGGTEYPAREGDFVFFAVNDSHGLRSADAEGLSFLEFHAPSIYETVREEG